MSIQNKIDFAVILSVKNANPNGDPLNGNRPRETMEGYGEISDVCIKRKIRNRLQDMGEAIFVQSDDRCDDGFGSLRERADNNAELKKAGKNRAAFAEIACRTWMDVRTFGQVFAFKNTKAGEGVSVPVRGPVSLHPALSIAPLEIESMQITKSVNGEPGEKRSSDTMGSKHRVGFNVYVFYGSINCQLAEKTGFSDEDAEKVHQALITLFENDVSSARPDGSMQVQQVYWWRHNCKQGQYSSAKVHGSLRVRAKEDVALHAMEDVEIHLEELEGLVPQIDEGR
nr:type I-C CRISPR-associated protein Cas7/Csd2 [Maliibacterium massiliense]